MTQSGSAEQRREPLSGLVERVTFHSAETAPRDQPTSIRRELQSVHDTRVSLQQPDKPARCEIVEADDIIGLAGNRHPPPTASQRCPSTGLSRATGDSAMA